MSTGDRIPLPEARQLATDFARLFDGCWERWVIAGSVRRQMPDVGDIEHVVVPKMGEVKGTGLFAEPGNMLWQRCDDLLASGEIVKALYGDKQQTRWGEKYRGIAWRGTKHEIFTADAANWGSVLAIRTGPGEFSKAMVMKLNADGLYRQADGYLRYASGASVGQIKPCATEEAYFEAVGWKYKAPEERR